MNFFAVLLSLLAGGMFLVLFRVPHEQIGGRYHRLISLLTLVGLTGVLLMSRPASPVGWFQFSLLLALLGGVFSYWLLAGGEDRVPRVLVYWTSMVLLLGFFATLAWGPPVSELHRRSVSPLFFWLQFGLSAAILGSIVDAMICGHWYLVNSGLSLDPIRGISRTLTAAILLKILLTAGVLTGVYRHDPLRFESVVYGVPLLFWVRVLIGLGGGLLFNWMSWKSLEYDNTQAATGILYGCITWIILGEFSAFYITLQTGVPL